MIEDYRAELMNETSSDRDISTIPVEFEVERTEYAGNRGPRRRQATVMLAP